MILRVSAAAAAGIMFVTGMVLRDFEAVAIAALLVGGGLLLRVRGGLLGRIALTLLFVDVIGWMAPAAWSNAVHGGALATLAVPLALAACCGAGLGAAAHLPDRPVVIGVAVLLVIAVIVAAFAGSTDSVPARGPAVVAITSKGAQFSTAKLTATGPAVAVVFHNKDLFWHTFTIARLGLSVKAPLGGTRVAKFNAPPGNYTFFCAIPGHETAGMKGTLTVS